MPAFPSSGSDPTVWAPEGGVDGGALGITPEQLVSLGDLKTYLNYSTPSATSSDDALITNLLAAACDEIEQLVGPVSPTTFVERYNGWSGSAELILRHSPVISVTSVVEQWSTGGAHILAESTFGPGLDGYQLDAEIGLLVRVFQGNWPRTWFPGSLNIEVTYVAGYSTTPPVIQLAICELVAHWWTQGHQAAARGFGANGADTYDAVETSPGAYSAVPFRIQDKLKRFRRPVLG